MAPNVITLLGFAFIVVNVVTAALYDPLLAGIAPSWVYYSWAVGLFIYQTLDNVDGRQARRTRTSSALGHWFDHGVDSLNTPLGGLLQVAATGLGSTKRGALIPLIACWAMWLSTWEEYYTHTLYLGYMNAPTEGLLIAMSIHLVSAYFGGNVWKSDIALPSDNPLVRLVGTEVAVADPYISFVAFATFIVHSPACFLHVKRAAGKDVWHAYANNFPFILYNVMAVAWLWGPSSTLLSRGYLFEFSILITCTFGKVGPRVILAYLTCAPFPWLNLAAFGPFFLGTAVVYGAPLLGFDQALVASLEISCLHLGTALAFIDVVGWTVSVCARFCDTLHIHCLTIKKKEKTT